MAYTDWTKGALIEEIERLLAKAASTPVAADPPHAAAGDEEDTDEFASSPGKYKIIADHTADWEMWHLPDGRLEYCSPSCERITGYPPERFLRDPDFLATIIVAEDRPMLAQHKHIRLEEQQPGVASIAFRVRHAKGGIRWIQHVCQPVFAARGRFRGTRSSNRDVTEQVLAEQRNEQLLSDLKAHAVVLEETQAALRNTLGQLEVERKRIQERVVSSIHEVLLPMVDRMESHGSAIDQEYLRILRSTILELASPMARSLVSPQYKLTPREISICNMVRRGLASKAIAEFLRTSEETVRTQRRSIRAKLGLKDSGQNLEAFLRSLGDDQPTTL